MQDFSLSNISNKEQQKIAEESELTLSVSPICEKDGKRLAYVTFSDKGRSAEGLIPECKIIKNCNFSDEEVIQLEQYLKDNLAMLKKMASKINILDAFMGKKQD